MRRLLRTAVDESDRGHDRKSKRPAGAWVPLLAGVMAAGLSGPAAAQPANAIDTFATSDLGPRTNVFNVPDGTFVAGEGILGDERDLSVRKIVNNATGIIDATVNGAANLLFFNNNNIGFGELRVVWDGVDTDPLSINAEGLNDFDMTLGSRADSIEIGVNSADHAYILAMRVFENAATVSTLPDQDRPAAGDDGARLVVPYSLFEGGADFRQAGAIEMLIRSKVMAPPSEFQDLNASFRFVRMTASVRVTMVDTVIDPDGNPRPPGEPARPGDRIRYTVTVENPNDAFDAPSDPLVFTYDPTGDPNNAVPVTLVPEGTRVIRDNMVGVVNTVNEPNRVEFTIDPVPDRASPADPPDIERCLDAPNDPGCTCAENPDMPPGFVDAGCIVFQFEVLLPDEFPPGIMDVPGQGVITTDLLDVPTDDPGNLDNENPNSPTFGEPDPNRTAVASCGNGVIEDVVGEACDDGAESATCNADCTVAACGDGVFNATAGEQCDDGNADNTDGCSTRCTLVGDGAIALGGGGCSTSAGLGDAGLALLILAALWGLRRRRAARATRVTRATQSTTLAALLAAGLTGDAHAQMDDARNFSAERFALSSDQDGILDVESGSAIGHLDWDLGFWLGLANDPLAVYDTTADRERIDPFLTQRIGGDLVFAIGFRNRFQLGLQLPVILDQSFEFMDDAFAPSSSAGIGDIRLYPKVQLIRGDVDVSLIPVITLPTAGGDSYFGEASLTFAPMLAASRKLGAVTVAGNLGYRARTNVPETLRLAPIDELFAKIGAGYRVNPGSETPLDLGLSVSLATAAADILGAFNRNASETVLGANYRVNDDWNVFGGAGAGLNPGFATPDWRVLAGLRFSRRAELPLCTRAPDHPDCLCVSQPFHELCPMNCDEHPDDPRCPAKVACPDNPPNRDHDCDGVDTPPWLLTPLGLPPDGPAFETPEDKAAGTPPWLRVTTGTPPSIDAPPDGVFPPETIESHDYCPGEPGAVEHHGCPAPAVDIPACKAGGVPVSVSPQIAFVSGVETLNLPSRVPLELLAERLEADPEIKISVQVGGPGANRELAEKRAAEIVTFLVSRGVDGDSVVAIGVGSDGVAADAGDASAYPVTFTRACPGLPAEGPCRQVAIDKDIGIQFEVNSDVIAQTSLQMLKRDVVWVLQAHPEVQIRVEGHTSGEGALKYNMGLSQRRAESVLAFLVSEGIDAGRLKAVGYGPKYPLVKPEKTEADREQNRRIEFRLTAGGSCPCDVFKVEKVFFEFDSPVIKAQSFSDLDELVRNLLERPNVYLSIEGHTSSEGRAGYNKALSARRAAAVRQYLIKRGVAARRLTSRGWGEEKLLIANDDTDDKKETNRRVEFIVTRGATDCLPH